VKFLFIITLIFISIFEITSCNFAHDGDEVYPTVTSKYSLCVINSDGSNFQEFGENYSSQYLFLVQNDEKLILLNNDKLRIIDFASLNTINEIPLNFYSIIHADISQDYKYLVLSATTNTNMDIYLLNLTDFEITNLTNSPDQIENHPSFSHNNKIILYTTSPTQSVYGNQTISTYDLVKKQSDVILQKPNHTDIWNIFNYPKFDLLDSNIYYIKHSLNQGIFDSLFEFSIKHSSYKLLYSNLSHLGPMKISNNAGRAIFITNDYPNQLISLDLINYQANSITALPEWGFDYSISNGTTDVAYVITICKNKLDNQTVNKYTDYELWIANTNGSNKKFLSNGIKPTFTSDGSKIIFYKITHQIY